MIFTALLLLDCLFVRLLTPEPSIDLEMEASKTRTPEQTLQSLAQGDPDFQSYIAALPADFTAAYAPLPDGLAEDVLTLVRESHIKIEGKHFLFEHSQEDPELLGKVLDKLDSWLA